MQVRMGDGYGAMTAADWTEIERELPRLRVASARFLGEGWNARAYVVNEELVFRFPKHGEHWEELEREITFLRFARNRLPLQTPDYVQVRRHSRASAWGYACYRFIRGERFDPEALHGSAEQAAAEAVGDFLRALHSFRHEPPLDNLLPCEDEQEAARNYLLGAEQQIIPRLPARAAKRLLNTFEVYLEETATAAAPRVVLHADLSGDHMLMDKNRVAGVIDFGDVNWGDPDYDFMYLFTDFGFDFVEAVAHRYGHPDLDRLHRKVFYFGMVDQIDTILESEGRSLPGQKTLAWDRLNQLLLK